jgi:cholesterol transport system auxiliary component
MRKFIVLTLTVFLSGCSFSPVKVASESSYTITQWPRETNKVLQAKTNKSILITTPIAAPGYETAEMIYVMVPYQLKSYANHHWVSSPAQLLLPLLADRVRATGYFKGVVTSPFSGGTSYQLNTQLLVLQQEFLQPQSVVRLTMQATLMNGETGKMIASRVFEAVVSTKNNNPYGGVLATNKAANQVLTQIAYWVVTKELSKNRAGSLKIT